jgi:hypothetical protein
MGFTQLAKRTGNIRIFFRNLCPESALRTSDPARSSGISKSANQHISKLIAFPQLIADFRCPLVVLFIDGVFEQLVELVY